MDSSTECLACAATEASAPCEHFKNLQVSPQNEDTLSFTNANSVNVQMTVVIDEEGEVLFTNENIVEDHGEAAAQLEVGDNSDLAEEAVDIEATSGDEDTADDATAAEQKQPPTEDSAENEE